MVKNVEKINPENAAGFLVGRVAHKLKVHIRKFLAEANIELTAEELTILTALAHLESPRSMGSLAELLGRDPTTLKRQLNALLQAGLVDRNPSSEDGRVIVISITASGRAMVESTMIMTLALRERAMKDISEPDRQILVRSLSTMLKNLSSNHEKSTCKQPI
jgi:DNA-binding MarR family transcriptional regulator